MDGWYAFLGRASWLPSCRACPAVVALALGVARFYFCCLPHPVVPATVNRMCPCSPGNGKICTPAGAEGNAEGAPEEEAVADGKGELMQWGGRMRVGCMWVVWGGNECLSVCSMRRGRALLQ